MANAMEILGDDKIIYNAYKFKILYIKQSDPEPAKFIKNYINKAIGDIERYKRSIPENKWWYKKTPCLERIELKVNHYRQKFWYWEKLNN